jgi:hypothetical protein
MLSKVLETTSTPLPANGEWTSAWHEEPWATTVTISSLADQPGELFFEQSEDGSTVLFSNRVATSANIPVYTASSRIARYVRIRYKNGATAQTSFRASIGAINPYH